MFITYQQTSEQSYLLDYGNQIDINTNKKVISHFNYILKNKYEFIINIVPSFNKLLILFNYRDKKKVRNLIEDLMSINKNYETQSTKHIVQICYDTEYALDYKKIEKAFSTNFNDFIKLHLSTEFHIFMIGFMPGLPFLGILKTNKSISRLDNPRLSVPIGSVGVVDKLSVIYPKQSPGGWNIIGRTKFKLFDENKNIPILLPGDSIIFKNISKKEFIKND